MGRKSIKIARLPSDAQRARTYKKRGKGIVKKASEISVLCDIDVLLIMFTETGKLDYFSSNPGIGNTIQRFIQEATKLRADQEIKRDVVDDDIELMLLELQERLLDPGMEVFNSEQEFNQLIQGLHNIHLLVASREQMLMQQPKEEPEAGMFDTQTGMLMQQPKEEPETGMFDTQGGMLMQQPQEGPEFEIEDLYSYTDMPWQKPMPQLQAVPENGMEEPSSFLSLLGYEPIMQAPDAAAGFRVCGQPQGDKHMQCPGIQKFEMSDQALSSAPIFGAQGNVGLAMAGLVSRVSGR